jgi:hypothetical protein
MPYIEEARRRVVGLSAAPDNCGELNFALTMTVLELDDMRGAEAVMEAICLQYIQRKGLKYQHINDVVGAVFGAKLEYVRRTGSRKFDSLFDDVAKSFYRGIAAPYEDTKIASNGDLPYPPPTLPGAAIPSSSMTSRLPPQSAFDTKGYQP